LDALHFIQAAPPERALLPPEVPRKPWPAIGRSLPWPKQPLTQPMQPMQPAVLPV
jgi:hypothetical protein